MAYEGEAGKVSMCEREIKAEVLNRLRSEGRVSRRSIIANEWRLPGCAVRSDLAILTKATFTGIEIKSAKDSLRRLNNQLPAYSRSFDSVIVVFASKHSASVVTTDFTGFELWEIDIRGEINLLQPSFCPEKESKLTICSGSTQTDDQPGNFDLRDERLFADFKIKYGDKSAQFWNLVGRRKIRRTDLTHLSRFQERREAVAAWQRTNLEQRRLWAEQISKVAVST